MGHFSTVLFWTVDLINSFVIWCFGVSSKDPEEVEIRAAFETYAVEYEHPEVQVRSVVIT